MLYAAHARHVAVNYIHADIKTNSKDFDGCTDCIGWVVVWLLVYAGFIECDKHRGLG